MIADYFGVSTDYLVGLSDIPTRNETIRGIHEKTGLWEEAISSLVVDRHLSDSETVDFVSFLITNGQISDLVKAIKRKNEFSATPQTANIDMGAVTMKRTCKLCSK
ncbi:hypothetical protein AALA80_15700 [Oscillospiraceae bacterium 50-60]